MSELHVLLGVITILLAVLVLRAGMIAAFKIGYYEQKLKNRGVDISKIENIGVIEILTI